MKGQQQGQNVILRGKLVEVTKKGLVEFVLLFIASANPMLKTFIIVLHFTEVERNVETEILKAWKNMLILSLVKGKFTSPSAASH